MTPDELVRSLTERLAPLEADAASAWWRASTVVSDAHDAQRVEAETAWRAALADPEAFAAVRDARAGGVPIRGSEPHTRRSLEVAHDLMAPHQIPADLRDAIVSTEARVDSTFNAFRGTIDGRAVDDNEITAILRTSRDERERRAAWEASKAVGAEVADTVRDLVRLRNRAARALGARDHFALALATSELDETRLFTTLHEVDRATDEPFRSWKGTLDTGLATRFGIAESDLRPWHYEDPFFQEPPVTGAVDLDPLFADSDLVALTTRTYDALGLDVAPVVARSDLEPRAAKSQHAFCIHIDRSGDVRVLCNNVPNERWAGTMLHEFGHAAYDSSVELSLPWLLRTMHPLTTEGVAMLLGRLVRDPVWLREVLGVSASETGALAPALDAARRAALLVFARWVLVMTTFERGLYADPDADHATAWWDLVERYQLVHRPDGRHAPDWAAKIHLAVAPVYYQNYLYGELVASQLQAWLHAEAGGIAGRPEAGAALTERVFRPGMSVRWDRLVASATGAPLGVRALADELTA